VTRCCIEFLCAGSSWPKRGESRNHGGKAAQSERHDDGTDPMP
jgi:hypothetical protein